MPPKRSADEMEGHTVILRNILSSQEIVTLQVGPKAEELKIHGDLLRTHSEYFKRALDSDWKEKSTGVFVFDDLDPGIVRIATTWMYSGLLTHIPKQPCDPTADILVSDLSINKTTDDFNASDPMTWSFLILVELYAFADRFAIRRLRQDTIMIMSKRAQERKDVTAAKALYHVVVKRVYSVSTTGSRLRKLIVDIWVFRTVIQEENLRALPMDFVIDFAMAQAHRTCLNLCKKCLDSTKNYRSAQSTDDPWKDCLGADAPFMYETCRYHEHEVEEDEAQCKERRSGVRS